MPDDPVAVLPSSVRNSSKFYRLGSPGFEIGVEKGSVTLFVQGIAGDVLRAIAIQVRQSYLIAVHGLVHVDFDGFVIADAAEFCVLYPKV